MSDGRIILDWSEYSDTHFPYLYGEEGKEAFYNRFEWWKRIDPGSNVHERVRCACYLCEALRARFICEYDCGNTGVAEAYLEELDEFIKEYQELDDPTKGDFEIRLRERIRKVTRSIQLFESGGASLNGLEFM